MLAFESGILLGQTHDLSINKSASYKNGLFDARIRKRSVPTLLRHFQNFSLHKQATAPRRDSGVAIIR